jgi:mRNA interferase RelE/StbE
VASAALEFVLGPLLDSPHRVGKPLRGKFEGQFSARCGAAHRVRYLIDDQTAVVVVVDISRHADTYGTD